MMEIIMNFYSDLLDAEIDPTAADNNQMPHRQTWSSSYTFYDFSENARETVVHVGCGATDYGDIHGNSVRFNLGPSSPYGCGLEGKTDGNGSMPGYDRL